MFTCAIDNGIQPFLERLYKNRNGSYQVRKVRNGLPGLSFPIFSYIYIPQYLSTFLRLNSLPIQTEFSESILIVLFSCYFVYACKSAIYHKQTSNLCPRRKSWYLHSDDFFIKDRARILLTQTWSVKTSKQILWSCKTKTATDFSFSQECARLIQIKNMYCTTSSSSIKIQVCEKIGLFK